ncbi:o-succinylbenzoate synthase [Bacillus massiliglaciei]|uniref:o-succinylbenzoate synthase n=1 Tax=Bacillus massiliglaciei TaxID=1816693 RepID=UPI000DA5FD6E|nr:o-succinylbenzoate synthase [Bacillus massiliglaciei]
MEIESITLKMIRSPLKSPFHTHLETVYDREAIIVEARDKDGRTGYGETVPFSSPWYTEETIKTCYHMLEDFLIPMTLSGNWEHPNELSELWKGIRRNQMAKSGLEQAIWDLYAKQKEKYLGRLMGGKKQYAAAGVVIASNDRKEALRQIETFSAEGYKRYKVKISPSSDLSMLAAIRSVYPDLPLMADANSAYRLDDTVHLQKLDSFGLQMIEQPLGVDDIAEHSLLQKEIKTPVCLDESICSYHDAKSAIMLGSCQIINIKMARVGGWSQAVKIHDLCVQNGIPVWCGGMIEFGISRAHNVALASLEGFSIPGDLSSSSRYWEEDIIEPDITVRNGEVKVPDSPGIGFRINEKRLKELTVYRETFKAM